MLVTFHRCKKIKDVTYNIIGIGQIVSLKYVTDATVKLFSNLRKGVPLLDDLPTSILTSLFSSAKKGPTDILLGRCVEGDGAVANC